MKPNTQSWLGLALMAMFLAPSAWGAECSNPTTTPAVPTAPGLLNKTPSPKVGCIAVAGVNRKYYISAPNGTASGWSLVVAFHGAKDNASNLADYSRLGELAGYNKKTVVIFPQGIGDSWNDGRANLYNDRDDVAFFDALVTQVKAKYNIAAGKTYVAGISNGGLMALRLACERSSASGKSTYVSGAGVVAAAMTPELQALCAGKPATPMVFIFGTEDKIFAQDPVGGSGTIGGGGTHIGITETVKFWASRNSCATPSSAIALPDIDTTKDKSTVEHYAYTSCTSGKKIAYYKVVGGGHRWPDTATPDLKVNGTLLGIGFANRDIDSYKLMATHWGLTQ